MTKYEFIFINMTIYVSLNLVQCKVGNYPEKACKGGIFNEQQLNLQWIKAPQGERNLCSEAKISVVSYT